MAWIIIAVLKSAKVVGGVIGVANEIGMQCFQQRMKTMMSITCYGWKSLSDYDDGTKFSEMKIL